MSFLKIETKNGLHLVCDEKHYKDAKAGFDELYPPTERERYSKEEMDMFFVNYLAGYLEVVKKITTSGLREIF